MIWLIFALLWTAFHLAAYWLHYRNDPIVNSASGIFHYHVRSFGAAVGFAAVVAISNEGWSGVVAPLIVAGWHGIYSMTKLEVWALVDGGFSTSILDVLSKSDSEIDQSVALRSIESIGDVKRADRLAHFLSAGWITENQDSYQLTRKGRLIAATAHTVSGFFHLRKV